MSKVFTDKEKHPTAKPLPKKLKVSLKWLKTVDF